MTCRGLTKVYILIVSVLMLSGCTRAHTSGAMNIPRQSFIFITHQFLVQACDEAQDQCASLMASTLTGSGFLIASRGGESYGITAGHVCMIAVPGLPDGLVPRVATRLNVYSLGGLAHQAHVVRTDPTLDLCLLKINAPAQQVVELSPTPPSPGDRAYTMSAPLGTFDPSGMLLLFEGLYSGSTFASESPMAAYGGEPTRLDAYTIPSRGGSSGSPILNEEGQLIGVTSMALVNFENMCLSPNYEGLRGFVTSSLREIYTGGRE